jgi:hypothetical protein
MISYMITVSLISHYIMVKYAKIYQEKETMLKASLIEEKERQVNLLLIKY